MGYITSSSRHHTSRVHLATATLEWNHWNGIDDQPLVAWWQCCVQLDEACQNPLSTVRVHVDGSTSSVGVSHFVSPVHPLPIGIIPRYVISTTQKWSSAPVHPYQSSIHSFVDAYVFFCLFETFPRLQLCIPSRFGWHVAVVARRSQMWGPIPVCLHLKLEQLQELESSTILYVHMYTYMIIHVI